MQNSEIKCNKIGWVLYITTLVLIPFALLVSVMVSTQYTFDQLQPIIWLCGHFILRSCLIILPNAATDQSEAWRLTYILVSFGWFIYGLVLFASGISIATNHNLWLLLLITWIVDLFATICVYPCLIYFEKQSRRQSPAHPAPPAVQPQPVRPARIQAEILVAEIEQGLRDITIIGQMFDRRNEEKKSVVDDTKVVVHGFYNSCSICSENFKEAESVKELPCKHLYHPGCIDPWFATHATCPICRESVSKS